MILKWKLVIILAISVLIASYFVFSTIQIEEGDDQGYKIENITGINQNGIEVSLSSIKNKYILIDFWASWCMPCRKFNPFLVEFYKKNNSFIEIFSISLDNNLEKWTSAIAKDGLAWEYHICELKGWESPIAKKYTIEEIPNNILIDKNGIIIGRNLDLEEILDLCK